MNVPKLRFKEFDDEWNKFLLSSIAEKIQDGTHFSPEVCASGQFLYITSKNVKNGYLDLSTALYVSEKSHNEIYKRCDVKQGDVLITKDGTIGQVCVNSLSEPFSMLSSVAFIRTKEKFNNHFLYHLLLSPNGQKEIIKSIAGQALQRITLTKLNNFSYSFPTSFEQTKIANFLTAIDEKITQLTQKYDLLKQYKKGVMQQIFSQKLRFKDEDGREFPEWEERELKDIAHINPKTDSLPDEFVYIDLESVEKGMLLKETTISKDIAPSRAQRLLRREDVLFQMVRPYQKNNLFFDKTGNYVASTGYAQIQAYEDSRFLYHCLHLDDFIAEVMNRCTGTSYPAINSSDLASITVQVPSREEQTKIANFLTAIDDKITHTQTQLDAVKLYKKGLLQQMFV
ncbi:restriction endonuclease subunit S [Nitrosomonas ureae]|uniref:Type I restriction enzyme, S subunit n=1 Tax=Nitrosomonas ureae TaxID=44577 RepID=A0A1H5WXE8_9PROT|nr:restriction endonuclease subunit S [Nitrosomonas ureae]SEG03756.1 type I restriction enzyme, S subunit [Nitrosomonas ureae]